MAMFDEIQPGVLLVTYADAKALEVASQAPLIARLEEQRGPVAIVFDVRDAVRSVPIEVPNFWLGVTARSELQLRAMIIVTRSAAVRVAARGFALANRVRRIATRVETTDVLGSAIELAGTLLTAAAPD